MRLPLSEIAALLGAKTPGDSPLITGVTIDSRATRPGDLFACFSGERVDGHDYAERAVKAGAAAILASRPLPGLSAPVILVADVEKALGKLARHWRDRARGQTACVTGTAGKTTLKDLLAAILREVGSVIASKKNHNNQIGLPLSLLAANGDEDFLVMEAGVSHAGDMDELGEIVAPDLAIILNVGPGHSEGLGEKGVAWHKSRLTRYLAPRGRALVCADYPDLVAETRKVAPNAVYFSVNPLADAPYRVLADDGRGAVRLSLAGSELALNLPPEKLFPTETLLAAAAAAHTLGARQEQIVAGIAKAKSPEHRYNEIVRGAWRVIDDTYNANPLSMRRMLTAAAKRARDLNLPLIATLGAMGELGAEAPRHHRELGGFLAELKPEKVFWHGNFADEIKCGLGGAFDFAQIGDEKDFARLSESVLNSDRFARGGVIFFKGSRANRLERHATIFMDALKSGGNDVL